MGNIKPYLLPALKVALVYAVVGGLWILFSDAALEILVPDPAAQAALQTWKGWFYVLVTAALLFWLVLRQVRLTSGISRALLTQREIYHAVFNALPLAVHGYDRKGRVVFWNNGCTEAYGYETDDVLAKPMTELLLPVPGMSGKHDPSTMAGTENAMRCGVLTVIRKDGTLARVHSTRLSLPLPGDSRFYFLDIPVSQEADVESPPTSIL